MSRLSAILETLLLMGAASSAIGLALVLTLTPVPWTAALSLTGIGVLALMIWLLIDIAAGIWTYG